MNYLEQFKVFQTFRGKISPPKKINPTKATRGPGAGWMVDCRIKHIALLWLSLIKPRLSFSPSALLAISGMRTEFLLDLIGNP
jgi:hypothetical protein